MPGPLAGRSVKRFTCPACYAPVGAPCRERNRVGTFDTVRPHLERIRKAGQAQGRDQITRVLYSQFEQGKRS